MKNIKILAIFSILLFSFVFISNSYSYIPPTNAFDKIITSNGTVYAKHYNQAVTIKGIGNATVTGNNQTKTILINVSGGTGKPGTNGTNGQNGTTIGAITCANNNQLHSLTVVGTVGTLHCAVNNSTSGITSINGNTTAAQLLTGTSRNVTITNSGNNHIFNLGDLVVMINGAAQTITKSLTLVSLILGGNANGGGFSFTNLNMVNATKVFQNGIQVLDTLNQGSGISITGSGNSRTITNTGPGGTITTGANAGHGGSGVFKNVSPSNQMNFRNVTSLRTDLFSISQNDSDININSPFKLFTGSCGANKAFIAVNNVTGGFTCSTFLITAITTINSQTGPTININRGSVTNMSNVINSSNTISIVEKSNHILGNGSAQRIDKNMTIADPLLNGLKLGYKFKSGSYTLTRYDSFVDFNSTFVNPTIATLPDPSGNKNQTFFIKKEDYSLNTLMIKTVSGTIDGFSNYNLTIAKQSIGVISNGTNYNLIYSSPISDDSFRAKGSSENRWFGVTSMYGSATTTSTPQSVNIRAWPYPVYTPITIDKIQLEVATLVAGSTCRMGIYTDNGTGYPATLVSGSDVGTVSGASTGVKTNTFASKIILQPSLYWIAHQCSTSTTIALRSWTTGVGIINVIGLPSTMGTAMQGAGWQAAFTFGAFPHQFPTASATVVDGTSAVPEVLVHITG